MKDGVRKIYYNPPEDEFLIKYGSMIDEKHTLLFRVIKECTEKKYHYIVLSYKATKKILRCY